MSSHVPNTPPVNGVVLPRPEAPFAGEIALTLQKSTSSFPLPAPAPASAPNILLVMTDDVGFAASSTLGGPIPTPTFDRVAREGLLYNRFHTTALCSPTRAALLTGRNPHNASTGIVMERALGFPGYNSLLPKSCGTIAQVLIQNGYNTAWIGKNHNVPSWETSAVGPFDHWPGALGFEYFYGFIGGDCNQWNPPVFQNNIPIEPYLGKPDYHLDTDLADQAISWIQKQKSLTPDKPFFLYYVPGATHAPHHVPKQWIDMFTGRFSKGWDHQRSETHANQIASGIMPGDTLLTPRPSNIPGWDELDAEHKAVYARMMEVYAAYLHFTDHNIGRVVDAIDQLGQLDNTLIVYIMGDNGGSGEGTLQGTTNESAVNGNKLADPFSYLLEHIEELGGPMQYNSYPVGWSFAMCTPFQWMKRYASHFGGTRNAMAVRWPQRIPTAPTETDPGTPYRLRSQFHHVIDVAPTLFDAAGVQYPVVNLNGVPQKPLDGISMVYTWDDPAATAQRKTQYFEMYGNRAIFHQDDDGSWLACTTPLFFAWDPNSDANPNPSDFVWELYNLDSDYSEGNNLVAPGNNPTQFELDKLAYLQNLWWTEASKNQVLPLNTAVDAVIGTTSLRPSPTAGRAEFTFPNGLSRIPESVAPNVKNKSWSLQAQIQTTSDQTNGVIATQGGRFGGWGLVVEDNEVIWTYKLTQWGSDYVWELRSPRLAADSEYQISVHFIYDYAEAVRNQKTGGSTIGCGGWFILSVRQQDGTTVSSQSVRVTRTVRAIFSLDETLDIGLDTGTPIRESYADAMPFAFNGVLYPIRIRLYTPEDLPVEISGLIEREEFDARAQAALATE